MDKETKLSQMLLTATKRLRSIESRLDSLANPNIFQIWIILLAFIPIGLYILTLLSVLLAPWNIYRSEELKDRVFLRGRDFFLASIALYKLVGGQFVSIEGMDQISSDILRNTAEWGSHFSASAFLVCVTAIIFLTSGIVSKTRFNNIRLASYTLGSFPILLFISSLIFWPILQVFGVINFYVHIVLLLIIVSLWAVMTIFLPVRILKPSASRLRLAFGLLCGWLIAFFVLYLSVEAMEYLSPNTSFRVEFI